MDYIHGLITAKPYLTGLVGSFLFFYLTKRLYFDGNRCHSKAKLNGKTVIVTGANTGLGNHFEYACNFFNLRTFDLFNCMLSNFNKL